LSELVVQSLTRRLAQMVVWLYAYLSAFVIWVSFMANNNFTEKENFIWSVADLIRDDFKRGKYQDVILPLTVLPR
jgi:hypothetical protein